MTVGFGPRGMTVMLDKRCPRCGRDFQVEAEEDSRWARAIPLMCDPCFKEDERLEREKELAAARLAWTHREKAAGIPSLYRDLTWDDLDADEPGRAAVIGACREWGVGKGKPGLFLTGGVGVGKTRMTATAVRERLWREPFVWMSVSLLVAKATADWASAERRQATEVLTKSKLGLVLDDLDKVKPTPWVAAHVLEAVDIRVGEGTGLALTSNLSLNHLEEKFGEFGEPLVSRIGEHCRLLKLTGRDRRRS